MNTTRCFTPNYLGIMNDVVQRRRRECSISTTSTGSMSERSLTKLQTSVSRVCLDFELVSHNKLPANAGLIGQVSNTKHTVWMTKSLHNISTNTKDYGSRSVCISSVKSWELK